MNKIDDLMNDPILDRKTISTKNDILLFKNETLKDFKEAQKKMFDKYSNLDENIKNRLDEFEKRINSYEIKITELSKLHPSILSITFSFHQIIVTLLPLTLFPYHHKILLFSQAIT